jgi:hypothetical protein
MKLRLLFIWSFIPFALIALTIMSRRTSRRSDSQADEVARPSQTCWMTEDALCEKFDYSKARVAKLKKHGALHHGNSSRTSSCLDNDPFYGISFYSVDPTTGVGCEGFKQYEISLNYFVDLCKALERCCKEKSGLPQAARNNLLLYYGRDIPNMPTTDDQAPSIEFITFVQDTLQQGKLIVFSEDLAEIPHPSSTVKTVGTEHSATCNTRTTTSIHAEKTSVLSFGGLTSLEMRRTSTTKAKVLATILFPRCFLKSTILR